MSIIRFSFLLSAAMVSCADGFGVMTSPQQQTALPTPMTVTASPDETTTTTTALFSKTRLQYRNHDLEDESSVYVDNTLIAVPTTNAAFLPRAEQERKRAEEVMDVEIATGRVAMVAAILMFGTEIMSGTSLPEQIISVLN